MRLRNVKNKDEILNASEYLIKCPEEYKGKWQDLFGNDNQIYIEIGMGKGKFIIEHALTYPDINFIGIEKFDSVLARSLPKIPDGIKNLYIVRMDALNIENVFALSKQFGVDIFDENTINVLLGENVKYSDENVMEFMSKNFGDNTQITTKDIKLKQVEDFIFLILASIKSTSRVSFYDLSRDETKLDISIEKEDKYVVPNFTYTKKGE